MIFIFMPIFLFFVSLSLHSFYASLGAIAIGLWIGAVFQTAWEDGKRQVRNKENRRKMYYEVLQEEKNDNEYSIISWEDKK